MAALILTGTVVILFLADMLTKSYVEKHVKENEERRILKAKVIVRKVYNEGMALSVLGKHPKLVAKISLATGVASSIYFGWLLEKKGRLIEKFAMVFILGGGFSNTYDRLFKKKVTDYISFPCKRWKKFERLTFNLGDFFLFAGAILAIFASVIKCGKSK